AMRELATLLVKADHNCADGIPLLRDALELERQRLGPDNPVTINYEMNLGGALSECGSVSEGIELALDALARARKIDDPIDLAKTIVQLALIYNFINRGDEAVTLLHEALDIQTGALGLDDPDRLQTARRLADVYRQQGLAEQARSILEDVKERGERKFGP